MIRALLDEEGPKYLEEHRALYVADAFSFAGAHCKPFTRPERKPHGIAFGSTIVQANNRAVTEPNHCAEQEPDGRAVKESDDSSVNNNSSASRTDL